MSENSNNAPSTGAPHGTWAVIVIAAGLCLILISFLVDAQRANSAMQKVDTVQTANIAASHKAEAQLNALARGVKTLANSGNANAAAIVALLQRNGVQINAK